jgi:hypothetical protein
MNGSQSLSCSNNETSILVSFCPCPLTRMQDKIVLNEELIPFDDVTKLTYFKKTVTNLHDKDNINSSRNSLSVACTNIR